METCGFGAILQRNPASQVPGKPLRCLHLVVGSLKMGRGFTGTASRGKCYDNDLAGLQRRAGLNTICAVLTITKQE